MIATAIAILLLALSDSGCGEREGSWSEENLVTCVRGYPALLGDYGPIHSRFSILNVGKSVDTGYWPGGEASNFTAFLVPKPTPPPSVPRFRND